MKVVSTAWSPSGLKDSLLEISPDQGWECTSACSRALKGRQRTATRMLLACQNQSNFSELLCVMRIFFHLLCPIHAYKGMLNLHHTREAKGTSESPAIRGDHGQKQLARPELQANYNVQSSKAELEAGSARHLKWWNLKSDRYFTLNLMISWELGRLAVLSRESAPEGNRAQITGAWTAWRIEVTCHRMPQI